MSNNNGWIGVDLDGTLAYYDGWKGPEHIGEPIAAMVERVKGWLAEGKTVKIFTARVYWPNGDEPRLKEAEAAERAIKTWTLKHIGQELEVTNIKDFGMIELWDDRCVQVVPNSGVSISDYIKAVQTA